MVKKQRQDMLAAKILTLTLPAQLHRRFLKEAQAYSGNRNQDKEEFLFSLMDKYLKISKKKRSSNA